MQRAVGVPNLNEYADPHRLVTLARAAEAAGWDGFFAWDHLLTAQPPTPAADPQIVLGAIALATERIRFGALLTPLARRRPWKVARETATLDALSGGRVVFGAALGWSGEEEFSAFGEDGDARTRADRLDEGLAILDGLWSGEPVRFAGCTSRCATCGSSRARCSARGSRSGSAARGRAGGRSGGRRAGTACSRCCAGWRTRPR
jgi:alkanesulfonate monooxygenase SsuD/methylene tetrahydromethanopterin reductase-like flavin-dependent oxidoreductase (luciferase family)